MGAIRKHVVLPHPPEMVWEALTDPASLGEWLMPNDFRAEMGHRFSFRTDPAPGFDGVVRCEVLEVDPPRRLSFTWVAGRLDTRVTFTISTAPGGTRLDLLHEGFAPTQLPTRAILTLGWGRILRRRLPAHLTKETT